MAANQHGFVADNEKPLQTVVTSLDPSRIGDIGKAALVLLHLEHDRPLPGGYPT